MNLSTDQLRALRYKLANLYPNESEVRTLLNDIGVDPAFINLAGSSVTRWYEALREIQHQRRVDKLFAQARERFPRDDMLTALEAGLNVVTGDEQPFDWQGANEVTLEAITKGENTLAPVSFLERGLVCARSVARIRCAVPRGISFGTGFLIANDLLLTNNHVLKSEMQAQDAEIDFNYQESIYEADVQEVTLKLNPSRCFATSQAHDWTVVSVEGNPGSEFGYLPLENHQTKFGEYVQIIQHPDGGLKQLAYRANVVMYASSTRVQYMTDTMGGSSGSPVFNRDWQVVALHHRWNDQKPSGGQHGFVRNQGIQISVVVDELRSMGIL